MEIVKGFYRHFKGNSYLVEDIATHSETGEKMVVYRAQYGDKLLFVRPFTMFTEEVEFGGQKVARFRPFTEREHEEQTANIVGKFIAGLLYNHK